MSFRPSRFLLGTRIKSMFDVLVCHNQIIIYLSFEGIVRQWSNTLRSSRAERFTVAFRHNFRVPLRHNHNYTVLECVHFQTHTNMMSLTRYQKQYDTDNIFNPYGPGRSTERIQIQIQMYILVPRYKGVQLPRIWCKKSIVKISLPTS